MDLFQPYSQRTKRRKIAAEVSKIMTEVNSSNLDLQLSVTNSNSLCSKCCDDNFESMCVENEEMREFHLEKDGLMNQLIEDYTPADTASDQTEFSTFDFDLDYPEWEPRLVCDVKSDSDDELPVNENERSMQEKLADWAIKFNISRDALSALLCDLQTAIPGLPKDARTVLRTLKTVDTKTVAGGEYFYFGVQY